MQNSTALEYNLLNFIEYKELSFWDVKSYLGVITQSNFDVVKLGKYIKHQNNKIKPNNFPEQDFEILGVNNKTGLFDAYIQKGKEINQPYKIVEDGFLAYNPYRINVGSIGLKLPEHKYKYISPAYVVFSCKSDLLPEYLFAMFKTERFNAIINENTTGSVRQNLSYSRLGQIEIPLPSFEVQKSLVEAYQNKLNQADKLEQEVTNLEEQIEDYLFKKLGIELEFDKTLKKGQLNLIDFKELDRWDLWNVLGNIKSHIYPLKKFGEVIIGKPFYGANVRGVKRKSETRYIRITDINEDGSLNDEFVSPEKVEEKYLLKENDFLIARSGNTVGKTFLFKEKYGRCMYAGYLVKYNLGSEVLPEFLLFYTKSKAFKHWITQNQRVSGQPNINGQEYLHFQLPLPPIKIQEEVVKDMSKLRSEITAKKEQLELFKKQALLDFENAIFKPAE